MNDKFELRDALQRYPAIDSLSAGAQRANRAAESMLAAGQGAQNSQAFGSIQAGSLGRDRSPVHVELDQLQQTLAELDSMAGLLIDRVRPVLNESIGSESKESALRGGMAPPPVRSEIAGIVINARSQALSTIARIQSVLQQIEV
ncbi:hypothetical protein J7E62_09300 [Variovorax paradoxus]|nr:hypothetical protein [Variovorax paradoxus]